MHEWCWFLQLHQTSESVLTTLNILCSTANSCGDETFACPLTSIAWGTIQVHSGSGPGHLRPCSCNLDDLAALRTIWIVLWRTLDRPRDAGKTRDFAEAKWMALAHSGSSWRSKGPVWLIVAHSGSNPGSLRTTPNMLRLLAHLARRGAPWAPPPPPEKSC